MSKTPEMEKILDDFPQEFFGRKRSVSIAEATCVFCGKKFDPRGEFRDAISLKEFRISGICQKCQDETFGISEE